MQKLTRYYLIKHHIQANRDLAIDATHPESGLGRYANHSKFEPNMKAKVLFLDEVHVVCFFALRNIIAGEELLWDYGEDRTEVLRLNPCLTEDTRKKLPLIVSVFSAKS